MSFNGSLFARLGLAALLAGCVGGLLSAEPAAGAGESVHAGTPPPPPVRTLKSPLKLFRDLLAMSPAEREKQLANRSPESRKVILAKLQEYSALPTDQREIRLRTTELSWYLTQLMPLTPTQRSLLLTNVSAPDRKLVESRLAIWDQIPADRQKALLENETALRYLAQLQLGMSHASTSFLRDLSVLQRRKLAENLNRLRHLSPEERDHVASQFQELFELSPSERSKILANLGKTDRTRMEHALKVLAQLPPGQRPAYVAAVRKFAAMSAGERTQFLKNAERWKQMSAEQRTAWRALTTELPPLPPLPPGFDPYKPIMPPLPPVRSSHKPELEATNDLPNTNGGV